MTLSITVPERIAEHLAPYSPTERDEYMNELLAEAWKAFDEEQAWDAQIEADILAGKFDKMSNEALAAHAAGRTFPAPGAGYRYIAVEAGIGELDRIALQTDLPEYDLVAGDIGTVVLVHQNGAGYEVEFCTLTGETVAVATLHAAQVRAVRPSQIAHVRDRGVA